MFFRIEKWGEKPKTLIYCLETCYKLYFQKVQTEYRTIPTTKL